MNWSSDSIFVYADSPQGERPVIERFRVSDGQRTIAASLTVLQKTQGQIGYWFGLAPDNSLLLYHLTRTSEVYALDWFER